MPDKGGGGMEVGKGGRGQVYRCCNMKRVKGDLFCLQIECFLIYSPHISVL